MYAEPAARAQFLEALYVKGEVIDYELELKAEEDRILPVSVSAHVVLDDARRPVGIEGILRDMTDRKKAEAALKLAMAELQRANEQIDQLSRIDPLTGLHNRHHMRLEAPSLLSLAIRQKTHTAILLIDIDHFKKLNDTYGHDAGDTALIHVARILKHAVRPLDLTVRYGGEEFLVILPVAAAEQGMVVAERVRSRVEASPVVLQEKPVPVTVSIGVYAGAIKDIDAAIPFADAALYQAKRDGRNRVCRSAAGEQ